MSLEIPHGFRFSGVYCGIKQDPAKRDIALITSDRPCAAAGVYTQNRVVAAPVILDRQRTPAANIRAIVTNSGNANACTGEEGLANARHMAEIAAAATGVTPEQVLVLSTGLIGEQLPMQKLERGIRAAATQLFDSPDAVTQANLGMLTTDTRSKIVSRKIQAGTRPLHLLGLAKGAAMIGPQMATMLGILLTDAPLSPADAQRELDAAVQESFNCISVEGHMSTNDTVLLLANGAAGGEPLAGPELAAFSAELRETCIHLAREIPDDGEGATHLIEIHVTECATRDDAAKIAKAIANSPLVKTAVAGADPNWGRIVSAAGYAGVAFDPQTVELTLNGYPLYRHGQPLAFDAQAVSDSIQRRRLTEIQFRVGQGDASVRFWTCDLTAEYVHLNADYHT